MHCVHPGHHMAQQLRRERATIGGAIWRVAGRRSGAPVLTPGALGAATLLDDAVAPPHRAARRPGETAGQASRNPRHDPEQGQDGPFTSENCEHP